MMRVEELLSAIVVLQRSDLEMWIREELVFPQPDAEPLQFSEMACARVRLICTLHYELEIEPGTLPVVLSLIDQLYETRRRLKSLTAGIAAQDKEIQAAIVAAIGRSNETPEDGDV